jgi:hypothetical protein
MRDDRSLLLVAPAVLALGGAAVTHGGVSIALAGACVALGAASVGRMAWAGLRQPDPWAELRRDSRRRAKARPEHGDRPSAEPPLNA